MPRLVPEIVHTLKLPNFLGIGVQRAATTWLHNCFQQHPDVFVPSDIKEVCYFNRHKDKGLKWYSEHFSGSEGFAAVGEITPMYLHRASVGDIHKVLPNAKLIVILRDPVRRAYSAYRLFNQALGKTSFLDACTPDSNLFKLSLYADRLEEVFAYYSPDQVRILLHDDIRNDENAVLQSLFNFLEVNPKFRPTETETDYNAMVFPRIQRTLSSMRLGNLVPFVRQLPIANSIRSFASHMESRRIRTDQDSFRELTPLFREDILRTQEIIGRDLNNWLGKD